MLLLEITERKFTVFPETISQMTRRNINASLKQEGRFISKSENKVRTEASIKVQNDGKIENIIGPLRVMPGKLSVSRALGDIEAKNPTLGGNPNVVIAIPEIKYFDITKNYDFIIVGSNKRYKIQVTGCLRR